MLKPLRPIARSAVGSIGKTMPAPVEGWDAISPLSQMDPKRAIVLDNWFPQPGYVEVRKGYAAYATDMGADTSIQSLMPYYGLITSGNKFFAAGDGNIYDISNPGAATITTVTGQVSNRWQHVNYTTSANVAYLWAANGVDDPVHFNGTVWANPAITGVTASDIVQVNVYMRRLWGILTNSMDACYLPLDSVAGAATKFPLGGYMSKGGYLVAMATWTIEGGEGHQDHAVFISSRGQCVVFEGTNPSSDFELQGVHNIAPPIGRRCFTKVGGDLAIVTLDGALPLSKALPQDRGANAAIAITSRINNAMNAAAQSYGRNFGWELTPFHTGTAAILNVPIIENGTSHQYVMNTLTGAWCRFTGWDANCFAVYNDRLYFGTNDGNVVQAWVGSADGASAIDAVCQTAYNYFGHGGINKRFHSIQPLMTADASSTSQIGISTDFRDNAVMATPTPAVFTQAVYDTAVYDTDTYAIEGQTSANWATVLGIGQCASVHCSASPLSESYILIRLNGFHIVYEKGAFF